MVLMLYIKLNQSGVDAAIKPKMPDGLNKHTSCATTTVQNVFDTKKDQ